MLVHDQMLVRPVRTPPAAPVYEGRVVTKLSGGDGVGMYVWSHNRVGTPANPSNPPLAEHRSQDPLPDFVHGGRTCRRSAAHAQESAAVASRIQ